MATFHLHARQFVAHPLDEVFAFFSEAQNLGEITPPWLRFQIISDDFDMRTGLLLDYKISMRGIPMKWRTEITEWAPPFRFADRQLRGPYSLWLHTHLFRAEGDWTWVEDHVEYASIGGALANSLFLKPQLRQIFGYRQQVIGERFGNVTKPTLEFPDRAPHSVMMRSGLVG